MNDFDHEWALSADIEVELREEELRSERWDDEEAPEADGGPAPDQSDDFIPF